MKCKKRVTWEVLEEILFWRGRKVEVNWGGGLGGTEGQ